jgi:hypothetical protein
MEWQPIDTAPKDGELILLFSPKGRGYLIDIGHWWFRDKWERELGGAKLNPTHWIPLPKPPNV